MALSKGQAILATTKGKILSNSGANGQSIGSTTAPQHVASKLVPLYGARGASKPRVHHQPDLAEGTETCC
ncbi:hypothetical protein ACFX15_013896 [Malus domestica]